MECKITYLSSWIVVVSLFSSGCMALSPNTATIPAHESAIGTIEHHLAMAQYHEQEARDLEQKVQGIHDRITHYNTKPYLDPKSLRRDSLHRLAGTYSGRAMAMREQAVWHHDQAKQLMAMNKQDEETN